MADLEPDVGMGERAWRAAKNAVKAFKRLCIFSLLLVDDAETEEDLVGLVKIYKRDECKRRIWKGEEYILLSMRSTDEKASSA